MTTADLLDPQYLDLNYEQYYFIPWPDSQTVEEEVDEEFIVPAEDGGVFLSKEWLDECE